MKELHELLLKPSKDVADRKKASKKRPKAFAFDAGQLPFERLGDAQFELLLADIYSALAGSDSHSWYDSARRMNDGADGGRDVILTHQGASVGIIQCKRLKSNLGLPQFIPEICKFFLNSVLEPKLISADGEEFFYILAVAESTTAALMTFLDGTGVERFDALRSTFEEEALKVKNKFIKLKNSDELKGISSGAQLCDLFWARMIATTTILHRKEDLSRLVADKDTIKSTYFKLDTVGGATTHEIEMLLNDVLGSSGLSRKGGDAALASKIRTAYIECDLNHNGRFNVAVVQGSGYSVEVTIRSLLEEPDSKLKHHFGSRVSVIMCGSSALTADKWSICDDLVENYTSPVVLMVGCGYVDGLTLLKWKNEDQESKVWIDPEWDPASGCDYRAGWCWVKLSNEDKKCYVLVENNPLDKDLDHGNVSLRLAFEDVVVWPILGDDFVAPISESKSQLRRVYLGQREDALLRPNILLVSHNSNAAETSFESSLSDYHALRQNSKVALVVSNSGQVKDYGVWKNVTGFFPTAELSNITTKAPTNSPCGNLMRRISPGALLAELAWDSTGHTLVVCRAFPYRFKGHDICSDLSAEEVELSQIIGKYPATVDMTVPVHSELEILQELIESGAFQASGIFSYSTIHGVKPGAAFLPNHIYDHGERVMDTVHALCYLKSQSNIHWRYEKYCSGQLTYVANSGYTANVLGWTNYTCSVRSMEADIVDWAKQPGEHPELIVFWKGKGRIPDVGIKPSERGRFNIAYAADEENNITYPTLARKAFVFGMDEVESCYTELDSSKSPSSLMEDVIARKEKLDV
ncbi:ABC-three component system protein [Pseudomonas syringae]|uniref:ABC-three component system protein n=1 Tax=Pseudomonas syringae TaxID=317 RepID=UPI003204F733